MVERRLARLKMTPAQAAAYNPPRGMMVSFLEWFPSKNEVIALFAGSPNQPDPAERITGRNIDHELGTRLRPYVIEPNMPSHHLAPQRAMILETLVEHPTIRNYAIGKPRGARQAFRAGSGDPDALHAGIKKALDAAVDLHEIEMTEQQISELPRGPNGERIEPSEWRQKTRKVHEVTRDGSVQVRDEVDVTVGSFNVVTLDSG
jgi:hypothetical protein